MKKGKINEKSLSYDNDEDMEFINRTNLALERMDKSDMKGLSKKEFLEEIESW